MSALPRFGVLVPVKPPAIAKSRLADLGDDVRRALARAFAADTVEAVLACDRVARVLAVTDDHALAAELASLGCDVVPDAVADDLNASLVHAAAELLLRGPGLRLAAVCADLPALRPGELGTALDAASPQGMSFLADRERTGTTLVAAPGLESFRPRFGHGSRIDHLATATELDLDAVPSLRRDVDTPQDLHEAVGLGVGRHTREALACAHAGHGLRL
jgi:2-phospho-L-lactate/phosphoenolpyruvate guanylyltransferase